MTSGSEVHDHCEIPGVGQMVWVGKIDDVSSRWSPWGPPSYEYRLEWSISVSMEGIDPVKVLDELQRGLNALVFKCTEGRVQAGGFTPMSVRMENQRSEFTYDGSYHIREVDDLWRIIRTLTTMKETIHAEH